MNDPVATGDRPFDSGSRLHFTVQNDGQTLANVFAGDVREQSGSLIVEAEFNLRLAGARIEDGSGVFDVFAGQATLKIFLHQIMVDLHRALPLLSPSDHVGVADGPLSFGKQFLALRVHHAEFEIGRPFNLPLGGFLLLFGQPRQVDPNGVLALLLNHRFRHPQSIHALAQHFHRLIQGASFLLRLGDLVRVHPHLD